MAHVEQDLKEPISVPAYLKVSKVVTYFMYFWVLFGVIVLGLRVFLLAFSANTTTAFVEFVYRTSADYLEPFRAIFLPKPVGETGYLDVAALFAMIMYLLFAWGISSAIKYIQSKIDVIHDEEKEREQKLEKRQAAARAAQARAPKKVVQ